MERAELVREISALARKTGPRPMSIEGFVDLILLTMEKERALRHVIQSQVEPKLSEPRPPFAT